MLFCVIFAHLLCAFYQTLTSFVMLSFKPFLLAPCLFLFLFLTLSTAWAQTERIRYVATDGTADGAATSWATATTLQAALDGYTNGDVLYVKRGSYTSLDSAGEAPDDPRNATYALPHGITIYGGFAGTEANLDARDLTLLATTNQTTLEGNRGNASLSTDNIKTILTIASVESGMAARVTLDGFTVARANGGDNGGGLYVGQRSQATIRHCTFLSDTTRLGGAIYVDQNGTLRVSDSHFESNTALQGGAIFMSNNGTLSVRDSHFESNTATHPSSLTPAGGGALLVRSGVTITITTSTFERNTAMEDGAAILFRGAEESTITQCSFTNNSITGATTTGTVTSIGGPIHVAHNLFVGNSAEHVSVFSGTGVGSFINNTIYNNTSRSMMMESAAVNLDNTGWVFANNIIYGNTAPDELYLSFPETEIAHNLIEDDDIGSPAAPIRTGAITDPGEAEMVFASTDADDANYLRLKRGSVAVDGGNNNFIDGNADGFEVVDTVGLTDLDGNKRISNVMIDVGAYEWVQLPQSLIVSRNGEVLPVLPASNSLSAAGGLVSLSVTFAGTSVTGATMTETGDANNIITLGTDNITTSPGMMTFTVAENMGTTTREATLTFALDGPASSITRAIKFVQAGFGAQSLSVSRDGEILPVSPVSNPLSSAGGLVSLSVTFAGTSVTGATMTEAADADNIIALGTSSITTSPGTMTFTVAENMGKTTREATLTFTLEGPSASPTTQTIRFVQEGGAGIVLSSMPTDLSMLSAEAGMITATITLSGTATGWQAALSAGSANYTMLSASSGATGAMITLTYAANTTESERKDTVAFSTTGGTVTARDTLILTQQAASATSFGVATGIFADVRVVNPAAGELIIYGLSVDVNLSLHDVSGREVFATTLIAGKQQMTFPPLAKGAYLLSLRAETGDTYNLRLLRE